MFRLVSIVVGLASLFGCAEWKTLNADKVSPVGVAAPTSALKPTPAKATAWQTETFGRLTRFVGRTFRGEPTGEGADTVADIQSWDWALGGAGLSIVHALEDGSYGGETLIYQDGESDDLVYVYVTNAGFRTEGSFVLNEDGSWSAEEAVTGHDTITRVRSTGEERSDGTLLMISEYLSDGDWTPGHRFIYREVFGVEPTLNVPLGDDE